VQIDIAEKIIIKIQHVDRFRIKNAKMLDFKTFVVYNFSDVLIKVTLALG
jgi:hypothetical protein